MHITSMIHVEYFIKIDTIEEKEAFTGTYRHSTISLLLTEEILQWKNWANWGFFPSSHTTILTHKYYKDKSDYLLTFFWTCAFLKRYTSVPITIGKYQIIEILDHIVLGERWEISTMDFLLSTVSFSIALLAIP